MRCGALAPLLLAAAAALACGKKGPPLPPEPRGPLPPGRVEARQLGASVVVSVTVPGPRGDRPSQRPARAELLRLEYLPGLIAPRDPEAFRLRATVVAVEDSGALEPGWRAALADTTVSKLPGGGAGWTLRYAVRVRDAGGRSSPLVAAPDIVPVTPLLVPRNLSASATAEGIRLAWEPPSPSAALHYNVYRAAAGRPFEERPLNAEPIASAEFLDATVTVSSSYRYVVRSTEGTGPPFRESESCPEVTIVAEDRFPPAAPTGLVAVQEGSAVRLFWNPNPERDLAGYRLHRRTGDGAWGEVAAGLIRETTYLDRDVHAGDRVAYRVTAVDTAAPPNESEPSDTIVVDVAGEPAMEEAP